MECIDSASEDCDLFQDTVPVHDVCLPSSKYCARGTLDNSSLLPSDAEQSLRVRKSMAHKTQCVSRANLAIESLHEEADFVPKRIFK